MLPLADRRVLITRSRHQASQLAAGLEALGASTILIPTIELAPPDSFAGLDEAIAGVEGYDWVVFTSANAVEAFRQRGGWVRGPGVAVIGPATARAAEKAGLTVGLVPPVAVAESFAEALVARLEPGGRVLLVRAAAAREHLPDALRAAGAEVAIAEAYRTVIPEDSVVALRKLFGEGGQRPDAITFTSSSTAGNLLTLLEAAGVGLPGEIVRVSIGPITSRTLRELGLPPHLEAVEATIESLVGAVLGYFGSGNVVAG